MPDETPQGDPNFVIDGDQLVNDDPLAEGQNSPPPPVADDVDPLELAYNAGRAVASEPPERSHLGANPFPPDDPQHDAWLQGFRTVLKAQVQNDPATLLKQIDERIGVGDNAEGPS